MPDLGQIIRGIQSEIGVNLEVQDAAVRQLLAIRPGAGNAGDLLIATGMVWFSR